MAEKKGGWGLIEGGSSPLPILQVTKIAVPAATLASNQCGAYAARVFREAERASLTSGQPSDVTVIFLNTDVAVMLTVRVSVES